MQLASSSAMPIGINIASGQNGLFAVTQEASNLSPTAKTSSPASPNFTVTSQECLSAVNPTPSPATINGKSSSSSINRRTASTTALQAPRSQLNPVTKENISDASSLELLSKHTTKIPAHCQVSAPVSPASPANVAGPNVEERITPKPRLVATRLMGSSSANQLISEKTPRKAREPPPVEKVLQASLLEFAGLAASLPASSTNTSGSSGIATEPVLANFVQDSGLGTGGKSCPQIRLKLRYQSIDVLALQCYNDLRWVSPK
ncbi:unnamed protein product [Protopolystoma xenopodis]|uniref:Uncharacterized protein n=1 Tax=Protopolystoma xenopodis TaxID=117903 RepID=A0A448WL18_9PLAT|nr:unnamed protein product [Protopolystoma xenopodis]